MGVETVEIRQHEFGLDRPGIGDGVHLAIHVQRRGPLSTQHIGDGVDLADMGENSSEAFARGAAHEARDVHESQACRDRLRGCGDPGEFVETGSVPVRRLHSPRGSAAALFRQRVEEGGLADIRQSDDTAFEPISPR